MHIQVEYEILATSLDEAIEAARAKLAAFAPDFDEAGWHVDLRCSPIGDVNGEMPVWRVEVDASRGTSGTP